MAKEMAEIKGTVEKIYKNKAGFYNLIVAGEHYGTGVKKEPEKTKEGDTVEFDVEYNGPFKNIAKNSFKLVSGGSTIPTKSAGGGGYAAKEAYWQKKEERDVLKDHRISYQGSRNTAIEFVRLALDQGAVTLPSAKKDKVPTLESLVDHYTDQFYEQAQALGQEEQQSDNGMDGEED